MTWYDDRERGLDAQRTSNNGDRHSNGLPFRNIGLGFRKGPSEGPRPGAVLASRIGTRVAQTESPISHTGLGRREQGWGGKAANSVQGIIGGGKTDIKINK